MFVIHRMATTTPITFSLLSNSLRFLTKPSSPFTSSLKNGFSISPKISAKKVASFSVYIPRGGFCISSAVASTDSMETVINGDEKKLEEGSFSEVRIKLPTNESSEKLLRVRHTCAHVMAMAVQKLYPNAKVTIGPWIDNGFYYDFDMEPITDKALKRIKKEMNLFLTSSVGPHY